MGRDRRDAPRRSITAFFDERRAAQQALDDLAAAGVPRERVTMVEGGSSPAPVDASPRAAKGLWDRVKDLFLAEEDRHAYGEGLRRGGCLICVATAGDEASVVEILDREGAVDMDARQSDWELEGWDPVRASADLRDLAAAESAPAAGPARAAPRILRDPEAEGLRLRTYVASHDRADPLP